jgi:inorganic phosphate transporter, PiT family
VTISALLFFLMLFVAYANGSNDNFKGVATLYGASAVDYRTAITLATVATFAGAAASAWLAGALVQAFSGKGLVPAAVVASTDFKLAVAAGAGLTVILATKLGFPVSTTHGLTGALVGAGLMAAGERLDLRHLGSAFFLPLLASPVMAAFTAIPLYKAAQKLTRFFGVGKQSCLCIAPGKFAPVVAAPDCCGGATASLAPAVDWSVGDAPACMEKYDGRVFGVTAQKLVDRLHLVSAAAVSFARGLNDTPKIAALLLAFAAFDLHVSTTAIALAMAAGGLISARRVAETMSRKITPMNDGQALTANLVTAFYVIFASRLGLPVSTTHVAVGAIGGVGAAKGEANRPMIAAIVLSWILTLPVAALIGGAAYLVFNRIG